MLFLKITSNALQKNKKRVLLRLLQSSNGHGQCVEHAYNSLNFSQEFFDNVAKRMFRISTVSQTLQKCKVFCLMGYRRPKKAQEKRQDRHWERTISLATTEKNVWRKSRAMLSTNDDSSFVKANRAINPSPVGVLPSYILALCIVYGVL